MDLEYIAGLIRKQLPEFTNVLGDIKIEETPYFYFGNLGLFIRNSIEENEFIIADKAINLINDLLDLHQTELDSLLIIGVLEVLTDTKESQQRAMLKLNTRGRELFEKLFTRFHRLI